jgi:serine/threonine-protein kinase
MIADRYRIVAMAGRGGMGEVYRAEDLKLSQVVAIKLLPQSLSQDAAALARFHSEVRIARQVSHPNVCRVFDIGEVEGIPFISMEYVDGEDLASVVRRIGRLSPDKAIEVTRQICAGLAAAHERGVVHRDLKPANVMLDGAGKIRIMDFGLAGIAANIQGADVRAGTPAYMAPEQLAGKEVTSKSDLYSLGLVIYEILTGKRVFEATTLPELMKIREEGTITHPSALVRELDPLVERVILRCLEKDPALRPSSALQVAAALPGGDPLAAALAAGETPSPEMVAASGSTEGMRPRLAMSLIAVVILGLIAYLFTSDHYKLTNLTPMENSPEVLTARAKEIIKQVGITAPVVDSASGFFTAGDYLSYIQKHDQSQDRWKVLENGRPASVLFWYRQSPRVMEPLRFFSTDGSGGATFSDPAMDVSGMTLVALDMHGRLLYLQSISPQNDVTPPSANAPNWEALFAAAGLNPADYRSANPEWTPLNWGDARAAWTGTAGTGSAAVPERVEAAAYRGKPIYFELIYPWSTADRDTPYAQSTHQKFAVLTLVTLFLILLVASVVVVRRNVKQNRGDMRGAARLALFVQSVFLGMWLLEAHHLASAEEFDVLMVALAWSFLVSSLARVLYLALEPYVRRKDPHTLISWSRLIGGQLRDPLVGRDLLIGAVYGVLLSLLENSDNFLLPLFGKMPPNPTTPSSMALLGVGPALGDVLRYTWIFVLYALLIFFLLFLVRLAVRKDWIAALVIVFLGAATNPGGEYPIVTFVFSAVIWLSIYFILRRFGLLALVVGLVTQNILVVFPVTSHLSRWYASPALAGIFAISAMALYGFYTALAGQPLFSTDALDK